MAHVREELALRLARCERRLLGLLELGRSLANGLFEAVVVVGELAVQGTALEHPGAVLHEDREHHLTHLRDERVLLVQAGDEHP